jgi:DNA-binding CsgD family transcriptional regulator
MGGAAWEPKLDLKAWRGDPETPEIVTNSAPIVNGAGVGVLLVNQHAALAKYELGYGSYDAALAAAQVACNPALPVGGDWRVGADLIEAAVRAGQREVAAVTLADFEPHALACETPWARGLLERSRALLAADADAEPHYRAAITELEATWIRTELARSHLVYGEWLRTQRGRDDDARVELSIADEMFRAMGAHAFVRRTRAALGVGGDEVAEPHRAAGEDLTPHEMEIAQLAAAGATNAEIAAQMFVSASTVDYHLRKVFRKLGLTSRRDLAPALSRLR